MRRRLAVQFSSSTVIELLRRGSLQQMAATPGQEVPPIPADVWVASGGYDPLRDIYTVVLVSDCPDFPPCQEGDVPVTVYFR